MRWALALLLVGAIPLLILALAVSRIQRDGLMRAEQELEVTVVDEATDAVTVYFGRADEASERVADILTDGRIVENEVRLALAREVIMHTPEVDQIDVFDEKGVFIDAFVHVDVKPGTPFSSDELLAMHLVPHAPIAWVVRSAAKTNAPDVSGARIMSRDGHVRGYVAAHLAVGALVSRIAQISSARFGADDRILVIDDTFRVVAAGVETAPGTDMRSPALFEHLGLSTDRFATNYGLTKDFVDEESVARVATVRTVPTWRWAVITTRPESIAFVALTSSRQAFLYVAAGLVLAAALVGTWIAARTTRPIARLVKLTRAYAARDFAPRSDIRTGDELEELGAAMTTMADSLTASDKEIARRATVETNLSRYLPAELAQKIARGDAQLELGGTRRRVTVLFADVVSFTPFAERSSSHDVVALLNELFTVASEIVFRHDGMVDKFIGDCVMAVFGTNDDAGDHERRAVAAAEDLHRFVAAAASEWRQRWDCDVRLGIGVASGDVVIGNLGSETRMEYTVIGDTVNVAARLETLARAGQTLVTGDVVAGAGDDFTFASLGERALRGKAAMVEVFELTE